MSLRADILDFDGEGVQCEVEWAETYSVLPDADSPCPDQSTDRKPPQSN